MAAKPRDRREYVRTAVDLPSHPKLAQIDSPLAGWLFVVGKCWAGRSLTDGHITPKAVAREANVPTKWVKELVRVGLWHEPGHDCDRCPQPEPGQLYIHDYLEHNRSREEAESARHAGKAGAAARWANRDANGNADRNADRIPKGTASRSAKGNGDPYPDGNAEVEVEEELPGSPRAKKVTKVRASRLSPSGEVVAAWAEGYRSTGVEPRDDQCTRVAKLAAGLLAENPLADVARAARQAGAKSFESIDNELARMRATPAAAKTWHDDKSNPRPEDVPPLQYDPVREALDAKMAGLS